MASAIDRTSLRKQTRRKRTSYREPDSDPEGESDFEALPPRRSLPVRAARAFRDAYHAAEDDSESSSSNEELSLPTRSSTRSRLPKRQTRSTAAASAKRKALSQSTAPVRNTSFQNFKRQKASHPVPLKKLIIPVVNVPRHGRIPEWQNLPYHVLVKVMQYAAYPLYIGASRDTGSARWLLSTSQLCTSFHDACIGALMYNPPIFPAHRANWLVDLLKASARDYDVSAERTSAISRKKLSLDYRPKVKSLDIEAKQILVKKAGIDLEELLRYTPLLKKLRIYHNYDAWSKRYTWALPSHARSAGRWSYGNLFQVLDQNKIVLDTFEWNGRFLLEDPLLSTLHDVSLHSKSLSRLRSLTVRNLSLPDIAALNETIARDNIPPGQDGQDIDDKPARLISWRRRIIAALQASSELREVAFHDSNIIDDETLKDFPSGLQKLEVCDCAWIKSEGLQDYLRTKGISLTTLVLQGNQSMSLSFMSNLQTTAPRLQVLEVDLTYHDPTSYKDTEPLFDELMSTGRPSWPSTLQSITIGPLRNLTAEDAENFYQSLVDAAVNLPYLRVLQLRTILNVSWRDRASLRQKWAGLFDETFHVNSNHDISPPSASSSDSERSSRKSSRLTSAPLKPKQFSIARYQGRCHTLLFELSDQRPAQDQYTEGDFLDIEPEEDEDGEWNGKDIALPAYSARRYAW